MKVLDVDQKFNEIYDATYMACERFLTKRCGNLSDIPDITQDVYLAVYKSIGKKGPNHIQEPEAFVITVARNMLNRYYKTHGKESERMVRNLDEDDEQDYTNEQAEGIYDVPMDDMVINKETFDWMWKEVEKKPLHVQKAFCLFFYFQETIPSIASSLGENESTVKNWIYRTKRELLKLYQRQEEIYKKEGKQV